MKPLRIGRLLSDYSRVGGTHHLAMVYGASLHEASAWGAQMGWKVKNIR